MKKIIILCIVLLSFLNAIEVKELKWPRGESFLTFLERYKIPKTLYFNLDKEDKELCSEIQANVKYFLYENEDNTLNQILIPISEDMQIHISQNKDKTYKFNIIPIDYKEFEEIIVIPINNSVSYDLYKATGDDKIAAQIKIIFKNVNFKKMQKGNIIAIKLKRKEYLGQAHGFAEIQAAMIEVSKKRYYKFRNPKDEKFYDEKAKSLVKTYFFQIPLTYKRISSPFTRKRWHPVLKRYRAHLGTDFAAPRGRKIYAAGNGRVEFIGRKGGYGNTIIINHRNGYKTLYAHQSRFKKGLKRGRNVKKGDHIGYVGSTGLSSGPHLHLGMYRNGKAVDSMKVIKRPKRNGLKGKEKRTFIANSKKVIKKFDKIIKNGNEEQPIKLNRTENKSKLI